MSKYRYPFVSDKNEWREIVNTEFYHESRNKGRRLTDDEKKAVVKSIKRDLAITEDSVGLGRRSCRISRLSSNVGESFGIVPRQRCLGSISDFDELYVDYLDYVHRHFEDLNLMIPNHHRRNLKHLLLRISSDQLRTLVTSLFNHKSDSKTNRPLWDEYKILCSMSQFMFFYMISIGYMRLIMEVDPLKYVVYDYRYEITSYDLFYFNENYGSVFSSFIRMFDHVPRDDRDPSTQILVLLGVTEKPDVKQVIENDRKDQIIDAAFRCSKNIRERLVEYGLEDKTVSVAIDFGSYEASVRAKPLKDVVYFSDYLRRKGFEASINTTCNNRRISKQSRTLGSKGHVSTLINYIEVNWDNLASYDGNTNVISHSLINILVPKLDELDSWSEGSHSSSVSLGYPILKSPEGVSFVFNENRQDNNLQSPSLNVNYGNSVVSPRPSFTSSVFVQNDGIRPVQTQGFGSFGVFGRRSR